MIIPSIQFLFKRRHYIIYHWNLETYEGQDTQIWGTTRRTKTGRCGEWTTNIMNPRTSQEVSEAWRLSQLTALTLAITTLATFLPILWLWSAPLRLTETFYFNKRQKDNLFTFTYRRIFDIWYNVFIYLFLLISAMSSAPWT